MKSLSSSTQVLLVWNNTLWRCAGGRGWSPSAVATIMVGGFQLRNPTAAHVDSCTAEGVRLEIIHFLNCVTAVLFCYQVVSLLRHCVTFSTTTQWEILWISNSTAPLFILLTLIYISFLPHSIYWQHFFCITCNFCSYIHYPQKLPLLIHNEELLYFSLMCPNNT